MIDDYRGFRITRISMLSSGSILFEAHRDEPRTFLFAASKPGEKRESVFDRLKKQIDERLKKEK